jgi:hypothetical protein
MNREDGELAQNVFSTGQNDVNWANESTCRSPYCAQSSFSRETSEESTAMLLQKENLYVVKGSAGMNQTYVI